MMSAPTKPKSGLVFGCSCPGCGADLEFHDSLWVTTCTHCDSALRIVMPRGVAAWVARASKPLTGIRFLIDRYCREQGLALPGHELQIKQLYYPYWRADASLLKVRTRTETRIYANEGDPAADFEESKDVRLVTLTPYVSAFAAGPSSDDIPDTLGLRAEYLRLFPFATPYRDAQFDIVPIVKTVESISARIRHGLNGLDVLESCQPGTNTTQLLQPAYSLIYYPYIIAESYQVHPYRLTVDAVTGKVLSHSFEVRTNSPSDDQPILDSIQSVFVEPHRCATCGNALNDAHSLTYRCAECGAWTMLGSCAGAVQSVEWRAGAPDDYYFPFWALRLPDSDRAEIGALLGYHRPIEWLVVPAFDISNTEAAYRLILRVTGAGLLAEGWTSLDQNISLHPTTVELATAAALADTALLRSAVARQIRLKISHLDLTTVRLLALPFHREAYFWVDSLSGVVTVERAAVSQ